MDDIFDLDDLADLPPELIKELNLASDVDTKLLELFREAGKELNLTQLLVGFYRKYGEKKSRQYMMTTCYRLVKKGFLKPEEGKGVYRATDKGLSILSAIGDVSTEYEVCDEEEDTDPLC